ncbi:accessory gene regulator B family protein [Paenibacillus sp. FSL W7-1279]|uniref:accessory gene regulator ArgB-like protein n=1 Tax=Paenibacillus TaxID=44249 RepID=UPI001C7E14AF|nr:accessory gene regulator B family protein [Paenibacillus lautus]MBX4149871.1 accessory gene regulator B family protein [Paenibacillus lautus]
MIIEGLSKRIAEGIKRQVPDHKSSVSVLKHAITIILNVLCIVVFTLLISIFTGNVKQAVIALTGFAVLRQFSGGYHLKTGAGCIAFTTALFTLVSFADMGNASILVITALSLLLVMLFAPSRIEKQSRIPRKHYVKLRLISCFIVMFNFGLQSPTLAVIFLVQAISLIRWKGGQAHVMDP